MGVHLLIIITIWLSALLLPSSDATAAPTYRVVRVIDGDTFDATDGTVRFRVRIAGIDAPELDSPYGKRAALELRKLIADQPVALIPIGPDLDRYNRLLAHVRRGPTDIGLALIDRGLATYYRPTCRDYPADASRYDYDPTLLVTAESAARTARREMWSAPRVTLPCEVRRGRR